MATNGLRTRGELGAEEAVVSQERSGKTETTLFPFEVASVQRTARSARGKGEQRGKKSFGAVCADHGLGTSGRRFRRVSPEELMESKPPELSPPEMCQVPARCLAGGFSARPVSR